MQFPNLCRGVRPPPPPTSVLDMTLNNLIVGLHQCWRFRECGVPSSLPSLPGTFWPGVVASDRVLSMGQIELFDT